MSPSAPPENAAGLAPVRDDALRQTPLWTRAVVVRADVAARDVRVDGAFHAVMLQWTGGAFLTAFALLLGAGPTLIGLLAALPLVVRLTQLYTSWRIERAGHWRRSAFLGAVVGRGAPLLLLPLALLPAGTLSDGARQAGLVLVLVLGGAGAALFDIAWLTWMAELVPPPVRGAFFARRNRVTGLTGLVAALGAAFLVDRWRAARGASGPTGAAADGLALAYGVLFAAGALVGLAGLFWLRRVPDPRRTESRAEGPSLGETLRVPLADTAFRPMLAFAAAWGVGMGVAAPFFAVYMLQALHMSLLAITATVAVMTLATAAAQRHLGRLADRFGAKAVLRSGTLLYVLTPLPWLLATPDSWWTLWAPLGLLHVGSGLAAASVELTMHPLVLKLAPDGRRASYLASYGAVYAAAQALAPLAGGALLVALRATGAAERTVFGALFVTASLLRLIAVPLLGRVREPDAAVSVGRMLRVVGRARARRAGQTPIARVLPVEPALAAAYTHLARIAEFVAREPAPVTRPAAPGITGDP
jgi:MFS family permease